MEILIVSIFIVGYLAIAFEHSININKDAFALFVEVNVGPYSFFRRRKREMQFLALAIAGYISGALVYIWMHSA